MTLVNGIVNPGFEDGSLDPWFEDRVFSPDAGWDISTDFANSGASSAMIDGNNELRQDFEEFAEEIATAAGSIEIVEFEFFVRHPDGNANTHVTIFYDDGTEQAKDFATTTTDWERIDLMESLDPNRIPTGVSVFGTDAFPPDGIVTRTFVDDFSLVGLVIPEPGSSALLMLGVAGLLLRRRRAA